MAPSLAFLTKCATLHHFSKSITKLSFFSTLPIPKPQIPCSYSTLLQKYGYPSSKIQAFLTKNQFLLEFSVPEVEKSIKVMSSLNPCKEFFVALVDRCPGVLDYEFMKQWEKFVDDGRSCSVSSIGSGQVLEVCRRFDLGPDDVLRCVDCLKGLGLSGDTVGKVLEGFPSVVMMNEGVIREKVAFFEGVGIEREDLVGILGSFPGVLGFGIENRLKPLFEEFRGLNFSLDMVKKTLVKDPRVLGLEPGELSHCLRILCRGRIKADMYHMDTLSAGYRLKLKVDCLRKYGLTHTDAFRVLLKEPRAILFDIRDIVKRVDFLIQTMKYDIFSLVDAPQYLSVNFEKHILLRFNVIEHLRSIGGIAEEQPTLKELINLSELKFYNLYVKPYPECEKIYGSKHPVGLWKILKPQKFEQSKEEIMLIRSYMEELNCGRREREIHKHCNINDIIVSSQ